MRVALGIICFVIAVFVGGEKAQWYLTLACFYMAWKASDHPKPKS